MQYKNDLSGKKFLIYDYGLSLEHALRLARSGNFVRYFTPWASAFPEFKNWAPGLGYEKDGLTKSMYFFEDIDWADCIVFFDIGAGDMCKYLRNTLKIPVYGAGESEKIENHRKLMRDLQKSLGLPMQETIQIKGVPKLREYLKYHENKFVKLDIFRGDVESFHAKNYDKVKLYLDEIETKLGPFNETYDFMVEEFIDGIEPGFDCYFNSTKWVKPYLWGIEQSKSCYIGKFVEELPKPIKIVQDKLTPLLTKKDYRGALSTEVRIGKDKVPYLIDVCARYPFPLSASYTEAIKNYSEVIYKIAQGKDVTIKNTGKYVAIVPLSSSHAKDYFVQLELPEKYSKYIKTRVSAKLNGKYYGVKGTDVVFVLVAVGNDYERLIEFLQFLSSKVDAYGLDLDVIGGLTKIQESIKKYADFGMGQF